MRKETTVFVPGTKHQPEARIETPIAGIAFVCRLGPSDWAPHYVYRFERPIPYRFIEEEQQKPSNWLPPLFKIARRGYIENRFTRLERVEGSETDTQLVFDYYGGANSRSAVNPFKSYVESTAYHLLVQSGASREEIMEFTYTWKKITAPDVVTQPS